MIINLLAEDVVVVHVGVDFRVNQTNNVGRNEVTSDIFAGTIVRPPQTEAVVRIGGNHSAVFRANPFRSLEGTHSLVPVEDTVDALAVVEVVARTKFSVIVVLGREGAVNHTIVVDADGTSLRTVHGVVFAEERVRIGFPVEASIRVVPELDSGPGFTIVGRLDDEAVAHDIAAEQDGHIVAIGSQGIVVGAVSLLFPFLSHGHHRDGPVVAVG